MVRFKSYALNENVNVLTVSIPQWFDSNDVSMLEDIKHMTKSQFHNGSIQI